MSRTYFLLIGGLVILALVIGSVAFYKSSSRPTNYPNQSANQPLVLTITAPQNGARLSTPSIKVTGKTAANADVSVNDQNLKADTQGNFSTIVTLDEGDNYLSITAVDNSGQAAKQEITVTYTPAQ